MFVKVNYKVRVSPTNRDELSKAELELRRRQFRTIELFRQFVPGCEKALIARTSPPLNIRRGRLIACDYDLIRVTEPVYRHTNTAHLSWLGSFRPGLAAGNPAFAERAVSLF
jgi:hypothetical protein